jgi:hypothetical protein
MAWLICSTVVSGVPWNASRAALTACSSPKPSARRSSAA